MKQIDVSLSPHTERVISAVKLKKLYDSEPWWPERTLEDLSLMLERYPAVGAWKEDTLVGFARAITDSKFRAYIEDVLVLKGYRDQGIGTRIMHLMMEVLKHIDVVTLFCQRKLVAYYESLGFKEFTRQVVMQKRNSR